LDEIHHFMEASARRIPALLNTTREIAVDKMDEETGIPYSCPAQRHHKQHNNDAG
jgi:hypothetical protein